MKPIRNVLALSLIAAGAAAFAHGDQDHGSHAGTAAHQDHAAALGQPGDPKKVDRTVAITMRDAMRFEPASIAVKRNETIRFVLTNPGKLKHEMVLGTPAELKEHAALMIRFPQMQHVDPNQVSVEPGSTGELVWKFTKPGTFDFACLQAGHYDAGMRGKVIVAGISAAAKAGQHPGHAH
ncbi:MAG: cupredoxin family protein [Burkholderiales bacterium]|nr:cupredoxin family protein [Burkholderiales bacterium]MDE2626843.1 cupredoxin family protein [Burkholderiales bacterium]